jgi:CheY-like chemotaxis protein
MPKILIIDDDRLVRDATKALLHSKGYDVIVAEDGKSGIEAARMDRFDAVIVDLFMPDLDGLQVIGAIRKANPLVPMIAASGFMFDGECPAMPNFEAMAAEAGAVSTLYKPFRPDALLRAVEQAIGTVAA